MQVYIGIDWSEKKHDIFIMNSAGSGLAQLVVPQTPTGYHQFIQQCQRLGLEPSECVVGLETAHTIFIDFLWDHHFTQVYVLSPKAVNAQQARFRQSGARSDPRDAELIADLLRIDQHHFRPWRPDQGLTRQMRAKISLINYLTADIVRKTNRLRSVLLRYYPGMVGLFSGLDTQIALAFIQAFPTPAQAAQLSFADFRAFLQEQRYSHTRQLPARFAHLQQPQVEASADVVRSYVPEAQLLANLLSQSVQAKAEHLRQLGGLFDAHPDAFIYRSLPAAGDFLEPALLAKFGDDRERFPTAESVQSLAGTCPVTDQSGKRKTVKFRKACDQEFRQIAQQWARATVNVSPWATAYYLRVRPHCASESHAYRCLANRWLAIVWKLWQSRQTYDQAYHLKQQALRSKPRSK